MIYQIIIIIAVAGIILIIARRIKKINQGEQLNPIIPRIFDHNISKTEPANISKADKLFDQKKFRLAEKLYIKEAAKDPDNPKIYNRLGAIYLELSEYRDAKDAFEQAVKLDPTIAFRHANLGTAHLKLGNYHKAIECFEKAMQLEPDNLKYKNLVEQAKKKKSS